MDKKQLQHLDADYKLADSQLKGVVGGLSTSHKQVVKGVNPVLQTLPTKGRPGARK